MVEGTAMREKQIPSSLARINRALDELDKTIGGLGDTIQPILAPDFPSVSGTGELAKVKQPLAPIASTLEEIENRVKGLTSVLQRFQTRSEV